MPAPVKKKTKANKPVGPITHKEKPGKPVPVSSSFFSPGAALINAWIFIPALLYFILVIQYAVNVPMKDDYDAVLLFLTHFSKAASLSEKLALLFSQHNEHRILSTRLITVAYYLITGKADFRVLIFIGNLQLIALFLVSVYFIRRCVTKHWNVVAFIWGLCLFDPSGYENGDVAMTSLQNFGIVMLFMVSLYFYSRDPKVNLIPAAIFQLLCIFSSGNGVPGAVIILVYTLFSRDKWKIAVSAFIVLLSPLYFYHYHKPPPLPGATQDIDPGAAVSYFFKMSGAHFSVDNALPFGIMILGLLLIAFPFQKKTFFKKEALPMICLSAFLVSTVGVISLLRSATQPFYASRYLIYTHLISALAFLFVFMKCMEIKMLWPVVPIVFVMGMLYAYSVNYKSGRSGFTRENLRLELTDYYYPDKARAKVIATDACSAGIYCIQDEK